MEPGINNRQGEGELNRTVEFTDAMKQEERAIRRILGSQEDITYRQLHDIEEIFFVGTMAPASLKGVEIDENGKVTVNGPEVKQGSVSSLQLISVMPALRKLALIKQPVTDVSGLSGISRLREVNLACSEISSLNGLTDLPSLYLLDLRHTKVKDLRPLSSIGSLRRVIVSPDMLPMTLDPDAYYQVILVK